MKLCARTFKPRTMVMRKVIVLIAVFWEIFSACHKEQSPPRELADQWHWLAPKLPPLCEIT